MGRWVSEGGRMGWDGFVVVVEFGYYHDMT